MGVDGGVAEALPEAEEGGGEGGVEGLLHVCSSAKIFLVTNILFNVFIYFANKKNISCYKLANASII